MMRYMLLAIVAFSMLAGSSHAAVRYWHLGAQIGADDTDWNDPDNWGEAGTNGPGVPGAADHVILNNFEPLTDALITDAAAPEVNILTPSWHDGVTSTLNIGPGGSINTLGFTRLSGGDNATSTVNFQEGAGISVWAILQMSFNNSDQVEDGGLPKIGEEADSFINLDGGILHVGSLGFSNNGLNTTNIDIGGTAQLLVNGDHTDAGNGNATSWISSGYLTAVDGTGTVGVFYDADNGRTRFTVQTIDLSADFDGDGVDVDGDDLALWQSDYANNDFSDADGDFDSDGSDFLIWQQTYTGPLGAITAVPEPASFVLLGLGCCMVVSLGKRNAVRTA